MGFLYMRDQGIRLRNATNITHNAVPDNVANESDHYNWSMYVQEPNTE